MFALSKVLFKKVAATSCDADCRVRLAKDRTILRAHGLAVRW